MNYNIKRVIELLQKANLSQLEFNYDCGGDDFHDLSLDTKLDDELIKEYDDEITGITQDIEKEVEFYVNSDGHYLGEYGKIYVYLSDTKDNLSVEEIQSINLNLYNEDSEEYNEDLDIDTDYHIWYSKQGYDRYNEPVSIQTSFIEGLNDEDTERLELFIKKYINGVDIRSGLISEPDKTPYWDLMPFIEYKLDFILDNDLNYCLELLKSQINKAIANIDEQIDNISLNEDSYVQDYDNKIIVDLDDYELITTIYVEESIKQ